MGLPSPGYWLTVGKGASLALSFPFLSWLRVNGVSYLGVICSVRSAATCHCSVTSGNLQKDSLVGVPPAFSQECLVKEDLGCDTVFEISVEVPESL